MSLPREISFETEISQHRWFCAEERRTALISAAVTVKIDVRSLPPTVPGIAKSNHQHD